MLFLRRIGSPQLRSELAMFKVVWAKQIVDLAAAGVSTVGALII